MATRAECRALTVRDIHSLLAMLVRDADEAGMALTAQAIEFALVVAKFEAHTLSNASVVPLTDDRRR